MNRNRAAAAILVALGLLLIAGSVAVYDRRGYHTPTDAGIVPGGTNDLAALLPAGAVPAVRPTAKTPATAPPVRITIANIGITAPVVPVSTHKGALDVPDDVNTLGWWKAGAQPGALHGSVVIDGHVDSYQQGHGALFHLESVVLGSRVAVKTTHGVVTYKVVGRRVYDKADLPSSVFTQTGQPRLVLITCGGPFDAATAHYRDNVVVFAVPV